MKNPDELLSDLAQLPPVPRAWNKPKSFAYITLIKSY